MNRCMHMKCILSTKCVLAAPMTGPTRGMPWAAVSRPCPEMPSSPKWAARLSKRVLFPPAGMASCAAASFPSSLGPHLVELSIPSIGQGLLASPDLCQPAQRRLAMQAWCCSTSDIQKWCNLLLSARVWCHAGSGARLRAAGRYGPAVSRRAGSHRHQVHASALHREPHPSYLPPLAESTPKRVQGSDL